MGPFRHFICVILCLFLISSTLVPVQAVQEDSAQDLIQQMLNYYRHHQDRAKTDIYHLLDQLDDVNAEKGVLWRQIFDHWFYAIKDLPVNNTSLPDDLPQDDSLCIVVLGYRLHPTGAMEPELLGRLNLALEAARQYPNALLVCTGGGTAAESPGTTEADQMARWLRQQGIDSKRILVERSSFHTIQNAQFTLQLLSRDYPQVRSLVLVTSDYHLPRSSTLFRAQCLLTAEIDQRETVELAGFLGYEAGHEGISEDPLDQTAHVARLCGFEYEQAEEPPLSMLTGLRLDVPTVLPVGADLSLTVTADYDSGCTRIITEECRVSGYNADVPYPQILSVTYCENGRQLVSCLRILRPPMETEPATEAPTDVMPTESTISIPAAQTSDFVFLLIPAGLIAVAMILCILRKRR